MRRRAGLHFVWINSSFHTMLMGNRNVRTCLSLMIALVFLIAATPGSMAMPTVPVSHDASASPAMAAMDCCDHAAQSPSKQAPSNKADTDQNSPCKNTAGCLGLLGCAGLAAVPTGHVAMPVLATGAATSWRNQSANGLSVPPDDPPPIA